MAPEMAAGEAVDARADLYGLGCVGYFLLTGALVFEGEGVMQMVLKHIQCEPVPPSARLGRPVPEPLERLILQCLAKAPAARPPDAATLAEGLTRVGANDWTQADARRWWESTFTPGPSGEPKGWPPTEVLEVAWPGGAASS
jgi:serine/threonine-protein kinase